MIVFVQNNRVTANTARLATAARTLGIDIMDVSFPWENQPTTIGDSIFPYGSVAFAAALRRDAAWLPFVSWSQEAFSADHWADVYGERYIGHQGHAVCTDEVRRLLPAAVRPLVGNKSFAGGVYAADSWMPPPERTMAWVAPIVSITKEVRVWIVNDVPVCAGQYRPSVLRFDLSEVSTFLDGILPAPQSNIVVDLALTGEGWKILEFNCINTAGFYAIDEADLLRALDRLPR